MITVCIFTLRDAMRMVQKSFKVTNYGIRHSKPDATLEIKKLADLLEEHSLQSYIPRRPGNEFVSPIDDLLHRGSSHANNPKAYAAFRPPHHRAQNIGIPSPSISTADTARSESSTMIPNVHEGGETPYADPDIPLLRSEDGDEETGNEGGMEPDEDEDTLEVSREDLEVDEEERYDLEDDFMERAMQLMGEIEAEVDESDIRDGDWAHVDDS